MAGQLFSASSLSTYLRCGKQWEFAYVYAIKRPPRLRMMVGLAAHEAVETNYFQKIESRIDLPVSDVVDAFAASFDRLADDVEPESDEKPGTAKDSGVRVVETYQHKVAAGVQPVLVEQEVQFQIGDVEYAGYVDLVDDAERVRDLKTTARKPTSSISYGFAMVGYAVGYRSLTGRKESEVVLDYVTRGSKPAYWPVISDGPVSDAAIGSFAKTLSGVAEAVQRGIFLPTGLTNGSCSWCGYQDICPAFKAAHGTTRRTTDASPEPIFGM